MLNIDASRVLLHARHVCCCTISSVNTNVSAIKPSATSAPIYTKEQGGSLYPRTAWDARRRGQGPLQLSCLLGRIEDYLQDHCWCHVAHIKPCKFHTISIPGRQSRPHCSIPFYGADRQTTEDRLSCRAGMLMARCLLLHLSSHMTRARICSGPKQLASEGPRQLCERLQVDLLSPAQRWRCSLHKLMQPHEASARYKDRRLRRRW